MMAGTLRCFVFLATITVAFSNDLCWDQTSTKDIQTLFPYCKDIVGSNSILENQVTNFDANKPPKELCQSITETLRTGSYNSDVISLFNNCMTVKVKELVFYQLQKVTDCVSLLSKPAIITAVKQIMYSHIIDKKIYKSAMKYVNEKRTEENKCEIEQFFDCIGYHPDIWFQTHDYH